MSENSQLIKSIQKYFNRCYILVLPLLLMESACIAADTGPSLRFLAERAPDNLGAVILAVGKVETAPFELSAAHLSDPIKAPARTIILRLKEKPITLAKIVLPQNGDSFIVLLIPNPKGGYLPVVIPSDDPAFRGGDVYLYNHAEKPVIGHVGAAKFLLNPGEGKLLRPAGAHEETFYDVGFAVREGHDNTSSQTEADQAVRAQAGYRLLRTVRWPVVTRSRSYVFFYHNRLKNRIDYRAVDEVLTPPENIPPP